MNIHKTPYFAPQKAKIKPIFRLYRTLFLLKNNILTLVFVIPNVIPN
nr:MAG TPA: hypothetical protein [Bacteriophage sp.]